MPIPDYQSIMLPLLEFASDEKEHSFRETINHISEHFNLTPEEKRKMLPSGYDRIIDNRVGWSRTYLKKAGLLKDPRRGYFKITQRGMEVLEKTPSEINVKFLMKFPEFVEFRTPKTKETTPLEEEAETPEEFMEKGNETLLENLSQELLDKLRKSPPEFFEKVVVDLLNKMGYGKGEVTGGPGDGGIDGIIYQDPLKLDRIYLQAKRYSENNVVGSGDIWKFIGVLENRGAQKGVFITTSTFHHNVSEIIHDTRKDIVLIDAEKLVDLMITHGLAVTVDKIYEIKKIDYDYFEE